MTQVISKKDLLSWLGQLISENTLIAPTRKEELVLFSPIAKVEDIVLDFDNTVLSPKGWFFPATETLVTIERKDGQTELIPATEEQEAVIFGIRPCDAKGIALIDEPFLASPADTLYQQRRARTTLIGLACLKACPECFCTSMGSGPHDSSNVDILLTEAGDDYIVQAITERGKTLLSTTPLRESEASAPSLPTVNPVPTENITQVARRVFNEPLWDRVADRCLHCNICAYVCPTCYCFDIRDYTNRGQIERVRSWESCQSPGFTKIAGGYDPRSTKGTRLRQRFYHKVLYFPEQFDGIACTGCGRCVRSCPVNIDIREIITEMQELGSTQQ